MPRHKKIWKALLKMSPKERKLFWIRFSILTAFACLAIGMGLYAKEIEHISFALIGAKMCDTIGEALAEAIASTEE